MKLLSRLPFDQVGHAPGGPKCCAVSQHFRAFFEPAAQLLQLFGKHSRFAPGSAGLEQGLSPLLSPGLVPSANRLPMDLQFAGYLALTQPSVKEPRRLETAPFQAIEVAFYAFWIAHAPTIARVFSVSLYYANVNKTRPDYYGEELDWFAS